MMINITIHLLQFKFLLVKRYSSTTKTTALLHWMFFHHIVMETVCRKYSQFKQTRPRKDDYNPCFIAGDLMRTDSSAFPGQRVPTGMVEDRAPTSNTSLPFQAGNNISQMPTVHTVPVPKHLQPSFQLTEKDWKMVVKSIGVTAT